MYRASGLVFIINGGVIKNLVIDGADIKATYHAGAIAGVSYGAAISNCTVKNSSIVSNYDSNKDGANKVGAIVGYTPNGSIDSCTVENVTLKGYREVGGITGYLQHDSKVTNNTLKDVTIYNDQTNNYNKYSSDNQYNVNQVVGWVDTANGATSSGNTVDNVTIIKITN